MAGFCRLVAKALTPFVVSLSNHRTAFRVEIRAIRDVRNLKTNHYAGFRSTKHPVCSSRSMMVAAVSRSP